MLTSHMLTARTESVEAGQKGKEREALPPAVAAPWPTERLRGEIALTTR